ncbi:MAG: enoyl-CoA hydratase/isomerase family protein [Bacteroidia bacterium]|nr:enoyl-CoA hydratase/isomerase family protein [Bacteroidia bacterium]
MNYEILQVKVEEGIALVTISRPKALNALNTQFFREMDDFIASARNRNDISVIVLTGEGKAYVAGADIAEMVNMRPQHGRKFSRLGQRTFRNLETLDIPVIAAVNGFALGGGCELAMACDFRIASTNAKFGQPEVNLGLIPGYAGTQRLPRLAGLANALYLLMTADMIPADEALRIGLVQKVVEPEKLLEETMNIAKKIASKGPQAIKKVKSAARTGWLSGFEEGCRIESDEFGSLFGPGSQGEEGMKAFLEKRQPVWK